MITRLVFGSEEANSILKKDLQLLAAIESTVTDDELPMKSWLVEITFTTDRTYTIVARTANEAMRIGEDKHGGEAYDAFEQLQ